MVNPPTCAVTGSSGYVGAALVTAFHQAGINVVEFRHASAAPGGAVRSFHLAAPLDAQAFAGIDALVHCAWDLKSSTRKEIWRTNVQGSLALFSAAQAAGVRRLVFISSMSAFQGCKSLYGLAKLDVEARAADLGFHIVRPGLVFGPRPGGMLGALAKAINLPVIPLVGSGSHVLYLDHQDDLAALVAMLVTAPCVPVAAPIIAANPQPHTFKSILRTLAAGRGKKPLLIPFPWRLEWAGIKLLESLGLRLRFRSDSLVSLVNQEPNPDFTVARQTGITFRPFAAEALLT